MVYLKQILKKKAPYLIQTSIFRVLKIDDLPTVCTSPLPLLISEKTLKKGRKAMLSLCFFAHCSSKIFSHHEKMYEKIFINIFLCT